MSNKCPACASCGFPMERAQDHALGDIDNPYCRYCTDSKGKLLPYEEVLKINTQHYVHSQGITPEAAQKLASAMLADMPAWKQRAG